MQETTEGQTVVRRQKPQSCWSRDPEVSEQMPYSQFTVSRSEVWFRREIQTFLSPATLSRYSWGFQGVSRPERICNPLNEVWVCSFQRDLQRESSRGHSNQTPEPAQLTPVDGEALL